jgi:hypothetical protein
MPKLRSSLDLIWLLRFAFKCHKILIVFRTTNELDILSTSSHFNEYCKLENGSSVSVLINFGRPILNGSARLKSCRVPLVLVEQFTAVKLQIKLSIHSPGRNSILSQISAKTNILSPFVFRPTAFFMIPTNLDPGEEP